MPRTTREWAAQDRPTACSAVYIPPCSHGAAQAQALFISARPSPFPGCQRQKSGLEMRLNKNSVGWAKTMARSGHQRSCSHVG